ncbi:hypothetical protein [Streptomyces sp. NPDC017890]|uniref:hypothetical protein n=1 Tax=Streptomyces sp. NPDC017890 TaxID=3365015 RepID=UPI0037BDB8C2
MKTVTEGIGAVARAEVPPWEALPTLPSSPSLSSSPPLPLSPPLSVLPDLSGTTGLPGRLTPVGPDSRPGPSTTAPGASGTSAASDAADTPDAPDPTGARVPDGAGGTAQDAYGPERVVGGAPAAARVGARRVVPAPTGQAPVHRAPTGDPDGTLGSASGADQGTPRQGDTHAVTPHHRIPFRLVPGALVRADAAGTLERYRDIPVSPA